MEASKQAVSRCEFHIGSCIDGKYKVEKLLGEGAFGIVYKVSDAHGANHALKLFKSWEMLPIIREGLLARVMMEFDTGKIKSNYLVHSELYGYVAGNPYILMEYCPGGDLNYRKEQGRVDLTKLAGCVLCGLGDLHRCGKVHRDLKPENVLVKADDTYVLTDFGISGDRNKRLTEKNIFGKPKEIFGTYAYMPPEQLNPHRDATVLPTTDIFSFGVMMFRVITNELPFGELNNERDLVEYIRRGREGRWNEALLKKAEHGKAWMNVIDGCLKPDFRQRFQNTDAVLKSLPGSFSKALQSTFDTYVKKPAGQVDGVLLRVMQGEEYGKVYKLNEQLGGNRILTMGRADRDVYNLMPVLENHSCYISRKHCTLEIAGDYSTWHIRDGQWEKGSTAGWEESLNGTYVNSTQVTKQGMALSPGDIISIGDVKLRVEEY